MWYIIKNIQIVEQKEACPMILLDMSDEVGVATTDGILKD
jgi:hypothetical protein